jgi:hypothetical protein
VNVLWSNYSNGQVPTVSQWNGSSWSILGGGSISASPVSYYQSIVMNQNTQQIFSSHARSTGGNIFLDVYEYDGAAWVSLGTDISNGQVDEPKMTISDNGTLMITFVDFNYSSSVSAMNYVNSTWNYIGPAGFSNALTSKISIASYQNTPYVLYKDAAASNKSTVRFFNTAMNGIDELTNANNPFIVYPNPASDVITIGLLEEVNEPITVQLYNVYGSLVKSQIIDHNFPTINIDDVSDGHYIMTISTKEYTQNERLIIQK